MTSGRAGRVPVAASFGYQPALDGLRAVAVALVLAFHAGFGWMTGGYVGVSVFFTLSGFLITSLALVEHRDRGHLDVGAFYARRMRRLLPASLLCVAAVIVIAAFGGFGPLTNLRRDVWGALAQVYNWVSLSSERSYAELVSGDGAGSPLDHYWSLAIEEQFYWVWPVVLALVLRLRHTGRCIALGAMTALGVAAAPVIAAGWGPDAAYWATPARLAEILLGAFAALVLPGRGRPLPAAARWAAPAGLTGIVMAGVTWPSGSGPAYEGWLPALALGSTAVIVGLQVPGPARAALSTRPLVALGKISYGVYLYHWPIYALVDEARTGWRPWPLFVLRVAVTLAVATASYAVLESPVRRQRWPIRPVAWSAAGAAAALAVAVAAVPLAQPTDTFRTSSAEDEAAVTMAPVASELPALAVVTAPAPDPTSPPTTATSNAATATAVPATSTAAPTASPTPPGSSEAPATSRPARILIIGDSTAAAAGGGLITWAARYPERAQVTVRWAPGCGFVRPTSREVAASEWADDCATSRAGLADDVASLRPDVVVLMSTIADTEPRLLDDGATLLQGEPGYAAAMAADYDALVEQLWALGVARLAWIVPPIPDTANYYLAPGLDDPGRWRVLREGVAGVAARHPDIVRVVDLRPWTEAQPASALHDGLHYSEEAALALAESFFAAELINIALG